MSGRSGILARLRMLASRVRGRFAIRRLDEGFQQELDAHLALLTEENMRRGLTPEEARRAARVRLGGVTQLRETHRDLHSLPWLEALIHDLRYALRMLRKNPGFTAVAVLTLALGVGANTAIFSVIDAALLRPLPYDRPEQLVNISTLHLNGNGMVISPDFKAWQEQSGIFESVGAFGLGFNSISRGANLTGSGEPMHVEVIGITPGFFRMLGVQPILGRSFSEAEAETGHNQVALLSAAVWRREFGGDRNVLNRTIHLDGTPFTVVGVMPAGLLYPPGDLWVPEVLDASNSLPQSADWRMLFVIGRLKSGVSLAKARADLDVLTHRLDPQFSAGRQKSRSRWHVEVIPLRQLLAGDVGHLLVILLIAVAFVLLIACANLANLLLARAAARGKEVAVRAALGAGRARLARQFLVESALLAALGGALGAVVGMWAVRAMIQLIPPQLPAEVGLDARVLAFVIGVSACAVILFGLIPALSASRVDVNEALKEGGERAGLGRGTHRLRGLLVVAETALALVLLTGAGLLARSVYRLTEVDLGFDPHHLLLGEVSLPITLMDQPQRQANFFHEALDRLRALPGVEKAAATTHYPVSVFNSLTTDVLVSGGPAPEPGQVISTAYVSPDIFSTLGIPLREGRFFNNQDAANGRKVVILNESALRRIFTGREAVGHEISMDGAKGPWREVVGVVSDTRNYTLEREPWPEIYIPYEQDPTLVMYFVLRSKGDPMSLGDGLRRSVASVDPNEPVARIETMDDVVEKLVAPSRFKLELLGSFAILALLLGAIGLYGVIAYAVSERTHEIGVRMALGAERSNVLKLVMGHGFKLTLIGVGLGIGGSFAATRYLSSLLYGVKPTDPITFAAVSAVLVTVALVASYIPARRATRIDPMVALRYE
ncbi:MAG TPA: ABC transporter permease [Terriglobia bacterium]|nr:ABC transporter permease [Terriglobia bacterium]